MPLFLKERILSKSVSMTYYSESDPFIGSCKNALICKEIGIASDFYKLFYFLKVPK